MRQLSSRNVPTYEDLLLELGNYQSHITVQNEVIHEAYEEIKSARLTIEALKNGLVTFRDGLERISMVEFGSNQDDIVRALTSLIVKL